MSESSGWVYFDVLVLARLLALRSIVKRAAGGAVCTECEMPAESHLPQCVVGRLLTVLKPFEACGFASGGEVAGEARYVVGEQPSEQIRITEVPGLQSEAESFGEPWRVVDLAEAGASNKDCSIFSGDVEVLYGAGLSVVTQMEEPFLRRICAAVNATAGQSTEALEEAAALRTRMRGVTG